MSQQSWLFLRKTTLFATARALAIAIATAVATQDSLSCIGSLSELDGTVLLAPSWKGLPSLAPTWILSGRPGHKIYSLYNFCGPLQSTCLHSFSPSCVGIGSMALGDPDLGDSVTGGTYAYLEGCLGISGCTYCLWGPYFHTCQSPTSQNCFGQVMHNLGNRVALIFSSLDFSIPQSLVQTLGFGIVLMLAIVRIVQG